MGKNIICVFNTLETAVFWYDSVRRFFDEKGFVIGKFNRKNLEILFEDRRIRFVSSYMDENQWRIGNHDAKVLYCAERRFESNFEEMMEELLWRD